MHLLVNELKNDKKIAKAMFAILLADTSGVSKIQFGGYD